MKRRIAVIECEDAKKWEGYTELLWKKALQEPGEEWVLYEACKGNLPTPEEAAQFDAIIVAGSHYSAYEEHDWIQKLLHLLPKLAAQGTRMYGCCFGCQVLARALGGKVGPNPDANFVLTIEQIQPTEQLQQFPQLHAAAQQALAAGAAQGGSDSVLLATTAAQHSSSMSQAAGMSAEAANDTDAAAAAVADALDDMSIASSAANNDNSNDDTGAATTAAAEVAAAGHSAARAAAAKGCFRLIESHGDQVLQLPPGATLLASSATATNELWCWGNNILASQFHVEFDEPLVLEKIWGSLKDVGRLNEQQAEESRKVLEAGGQMNVNMLQFIKHFIKHGIDSVPAPGSAEDSSSANMTGTITVAIEHPAERPPEQEQQHDEILPLEVDHGNGSGPGNANISFRSTVSSTGGSISQPEPGGTTTVAEATGVPLSLAHLRSSRTDRSGSKSGAYDSQVSGCSSPTAASEYSVATASTSAIPFSHIANQRRVQQCEHELHDSAKRMVNDASAAFDLRMECYNLDFEAIQQLNEAAAEQYSNTSEIAAALGQFAVDLHTRQAAVREALAALPQVDRQLKLLEVTVGDLDKRSKDLEAKLGLSGGKSAYEYLASSFSRAGSVGAAAVGAGTCLGGGALPKQFE